jgi:beta-carotene hydroxylase
MLRYRADWRSVAYIAATTALFCSLWLQGFHWLSYLAFLFFSVSVAVMTHNHMHINLWTWKPLNLLTDWWLTVFYGVPIFTWMPTHNMNHHRFTNKEGDSSVTYRHTEENHLVSLLSYPSVSGFHQMTQSVFPYMAKLRQNDRRQFFENWFQVVVLVVWTLAFLVLDWQRAILYVIIPQQVSAFTVFVFNYVQHVHTDEESAYNHSRNFMGVNLFLFNNGYHTAHHERANVHWSELPAEHAKIAHLIDPALIERSFWWFIVRTYVLSAFVPKFRSFNMRAARMAAQETA